MTKPMIPMILAWVSLSAAAGEAAAPKIERFEGCAEMPDARQRLACFDREFAPYRKRSADAAPPSAPPSVTKPPPAPAAFGQEQLAPRSRPSVTEEEQVLHARIASLRQVDPSTALVTLDNGQVWRHDNPTLGAYLREGESVTLRKASLGAYRLTRDEGAEKNWIRITRVR